MIGRSIMEMIQEKRVQIRSILKPGDVGYVTYLHGVLYAREYQFDHTFEGYVAAGMGEFAKSFDAGKDCLWIAEMDDQIVGSIAVVGRPNGEAQLRWFLAHPGVRGTGLGRALLHKALQFCRAREFRTVFLWTAKGLDAARHLYLSVGFQRTEQKTHQLWGHILIEERYDLSLSESD